VTDRGANPPTPKDLQRLAIAKAKDHVRAARLLRDAGMFNLATFHVLSSVEEVAKSRMVGTEIQEVLGWMGVDDGERRMRKAALGHGTKLPSGLVSLLVEMPFLLVTSHPNFPKGLSEEEMAQLKDREELTLKWMAEALPMSKSVEALREQANYSGLDHSGQMPASFDWEGAVEYLLPLVEAQVDFSEYAIERKFTAEELEQVRGESFKLIDSLKSDKKPE